MEQIERQALVQRINDAIEKTREELRLAPGLDNYLAGYTQAAKLYIGKLEGLREFAEKLDEKEAEAMLATLLKKRVDARKPEKKSPHKHEQKRAAKTPAARKRR